MKKITISIAVLCLGLTALTSFAQAASGLTVVPQETTLLNFSNVGNLSATVSVSIGTDLAPQMQSQTLLMIRYVPDSQVTQNSADPKYAVQGFAYGQDIHNPYPITLFDLVPSTTYRVWYGYTSGTQQIWSKQSYTFTTLATPATLTANTEPATQIGFIHTTSTTAEVRLFTDAEDAYSDSMKKHESIFIRYSTGNQAPVEKVFTYNDAGTLNPLTLTGLVPGQQYSASLGYVLSDVTCTLSPSVQVCPANLTVLVWTRDPSGTFTTPLK